MAFDITHALIHTHTHRTHTHTHTHTRTHTHKLNIPSPTQEEAKDAFKSLLRSVGCASTWTWEQAFREIAGDRRYGALKTLGEKKVGGLLGCGVSSGRAGCVVVLMHCCSVHTPPNTHHQIHTPPHTTKACFNEYLQQRKREEKDEARQRLIQSREDFIAMLEGCVQLTAASKFSKARDILEGDPRWQVCGVVFFLVCVFVSVSVCQCLLFHCFFICNICSVCMCVCACVCVCMCVCVHVCVCVCVHSACAMCICTP